MKRLSGYPSSFYWLLIIAGGCVLVSGLLMVPTMLEFKWQWDMIWRLSGSQRLPTVACHALSGTLLLMLTGALWHVHMRAGWRKSLNHKSGLTSALSLLVLGLTGIGLYYLGGENSQLWASTSHTIIGIALGLLLLWHGWHGQRIRKQTVRH